MTRLNTLIVLLLSLPFAAPAFAQGRIEKPPVTWDEAYRGNFSRGRSGPIRKIIMHTIEGSTGSARNLFKSKRKGRRKVSAHYIVSLDGTIVQMVRDEDVAWHIKGHNGDTIGIEHEGFAHRNTWTPEQMRASARLTRWLCDEYQIPVDREHIVGHAEMPGQAHRRSDPGPHFKWDLYLDMVNGLAALQVVSPAAEQVIGRDQVVPALTLRWSAAEEQQTYRVQLARPDEQVIYDSGAKTSTADRHTAMVDLAAGNYLWRVHTGLTAEGGESIDRESGWTPFTVDLVQPTLQVTGPSSGQPLTQPPRITWSYTKQGGPQEIYQVRVSDAPWQAHARPGRVIVDTRELNGSADGYQLPNVLAPDTDYYYQVRVGDGRGNTARSEVRRFRTAPAESFHEAPQPEAQATGGAEATDEEMEDHDGLTDALGRVQRSPRPVGRASE